MRSDSIARMPTMPMPCCLPEAKIASNIPPALAPETIERKGSSVALIDTGQLRSSITWQVE